MKMFGTTLLLLLIIALMAFSLSLNNEANEEGLVCPQETKICLDGSVVKRSGPTCSFEACPKPSVLEYKDILRITTPNKNAEIGSPLKIRGEARGSWFFEGTFNIVLTDWDGRIIAETNAEAKSEWTTNSYVPFEATLSFDNPHKQSDPYFMKRGSLIFQKENPSGLPENDDAFEITVYFK